MKKCDNMAPYQTTMDDYFRLQDATEYKEKMKVAKVGIYEKQIEATTLGLRPKNQEEFQTRRFL